MADVTFFEGNQPNQRKITLVPSRPWQPTTCLTDLLKAILRVLWPFNLPRLNSWLAWLGLVGSLSPALLGMPLFFGCCNFQRWINRLIHGCSQTTQKRKNTTVPPRWPKIREILPAQRWLSAGNFQPVFLPGKKKRKKVLKAYGSFGTLIHRGENSYTLVGGFTFPK